MSRRRQRRLRAQWRHEKQSVAMALAEALHHSSGPTTMKVVERREGPVGEVRETHDGLRAQERPLPGTRPAPLSVVAEPQDRLEAAARVSSGVPSVAPPALAAPAAEGVGTSTLRFLAKAALDDVRMVEEEAARRKAKEAEEAKAKEERKAKYEAKMKVINRSVRDGAATPAEEAAWILLDLHCPKKKEEEEEEEKDEAASLIPLLPVGGVAGDDTTRAVFLVCLHA